MDKPRICFFDIETSPIIASTWSMYPQSLPLNGIVHDWYIICGAWKFLGDPKIYSVATTTPHKDIATVKKLMDVLASCDVIVGQNSDKFDIRKLNAKLIQYKLPPLPNIPTVDTLKASRRVAAFTSHKLDYMARILNGNQKIKVGLGLWMDVMGGSKKALKEMVTYNKMDVKLNEEVYLRLLPYMKTHPHIGVLKGHLRGLSCPKCGSQNIKKNGIRVSAAGIKSHEIQCGKCRSYSRVPVTLGSNNN